MSSNEYHFITHWRVESTVEEVSDVLGVPLDLPRWWRLFARSLGRIRAEKPLLRYLSFLLKPVFSANHRWAMARGEESLRAELGRRAGAGQQPASQTS